VAGGVTCTVLGVTVVLTSIGCLLRRYWLTLQRRRRGADRFFTRAVEILENGELQPAGDLGYPRLVGRYQGLPVQVHPVIDTLAARRLPALWLLVTIQGKLPVAARFDLMMRPNAATTFSNFDLLPETVELPTGFPPEAVLRTDDPQHLPPPHLVSSHLDLFTDARAKELLITPNGVRFVWLLAEANRARYAALRDADFGEIDLDPGILRNLLDRLVLLRHAIVDAPYPPSRQKEAAW
jgi:hypothetical protein